jgi:siroheme synthase
MARLIYRGVSLIHERQTLVLYMGLVGLKEICQQLMAHGMRPDMPVALVSHGTHAESKSATLAKFIILLKKWLIVELKHPP